MTDTPSLSPGDRFLLPVTINFSSRPVNAPKNKVWWWMTFLRGRSVCADQADLSALIPASRLTDLEAEVGRLREALQAMVDEKCDYMLINHLGDPEGTHTVKHARVALAERGAADD